MEQKERDPSSHHRYCTDGTTEGGEKSYLTSRVFLLEFAAENTVNFKKSTV